MSEEYIYLRDYVILEEDISGKEKAIFALPTIKRLHNYKFKIEP